MTSIAAIIVGIDGWEKYTLPLVRSIEQHEPNVELLVVDNASEPRYPFGRRTERLCYSAAINTGKETIDRLVGQSDWYIVLSNDVLCTGPFAGMVEQFEETDLVGPLMKDIHIERVGHVPYIEGWCVVISRKIWDAIGGWDEQMRVSSYEDVEYSHRARVNGFSLAECPDLPFTHLDQKQRFYLVPDYWSSEAHNRARFIEKYARQVERV
jgi:hypothetical protein